MQTETNLDESVTKLSTDITPPPILETNLRTPANTELVIGSEFMEMINDRAWDWPDNECITYRQALLMAPTLDFYSSLQGYGELMDWFAYSGSDNSGLIVILLNLLSTTPGFSLTYGSNYSSSTLSLDTDKTNLKYFLGIWYGYPSFEIVVDGNRNLPWSTELNSYKISNSSAESAGTVYRSGESTGGGDIQERFSPSSAYKYITIGSLTIG